MKDTYRLVLRRRRDERHRRLHLGSHLPRGLEPIMDDPIELPSEMIDLASGELSDRRRRVRG